MTNFLTSDIEIFGLSKANITFFDVKTLYNQAYEQKAQARLALRRFKRLEAEAKRLEDAYRAQLGLTGRVGK